RAARRGAPRRPDRGPRRIGDRTTDRAPPSPPARRTTPSVRHAHRSGCAARSASVPHQGVGALVLGEPVTNRVPLTTNQVAPMSRIASNATATTRPTFRRSGDTYGATRGIGLGEVRAAVAPGTVPRGASAAGDPSAVGVLT